MYMLYAINFKRQFVLRKSIYHIYRYFHIIGRLLIHVTIAVLSIFFTLPAAALILYPCITSSIRKVSQIHCGRQLYTMPITCSAFSMYMLLQGVYSCTMPCTIHAPVTKGMYTSLARYIYIYIYIYIQSKQYG